MHMQVPTRKPGKYTNQKSDPHITPEKFSELEKELEKMKNRQPRLIAEVKQLASDGDFSENAAYQIAKGKLRGLNDRIIETEDILKRAVIIERGGNDGMIQLGSIVTVEINGKRKTYEILGSSETDPTRGVISHNSPLGAALIGRQAGETVKVKLAGREVVYKIIKVE
jgi:transcription elongation factor GreA